METNVTAPPPGGYKPEGAGQLGMCFMPPLPVPPPVSTDPRLRQFLETFSRFKPTTLTAISQKVHREMFYFSDNFLSTYVNMALASGFIAEAHPGRRPGYVLTELGEKVILESRTASIGKMLDVAEKVVAAGIPITLLPRPSYQGPEFMPTMDLRLLKTWLTGHPGSVLAIRLGRGTRLLCVMFEGSGAYRLEGLTQTFGFSSAFIQGYGTREVFFRWRDGKKKERHQFSVRSGVHVISDDRTIVLAPAGQKYFEKLPRSHLEPMPAWMDEFLSGDETSSSFAPEITCLGVLGKKGPVLGKMIWSACAAGGSTEPELSRLVSEHISVPKRTIGFALGAMWANGLVEPKKLFSKTYWVACNPIICDNKKQK